MAAQLTRKLAVLVHADVVGSTALVQINETLAHQRIQDTFRTFSETIARYNGIAHEIRGDALVAEFARASDAVSASLAFQSANAAHNEVLPDEIRPVVRVGISMGEVVVADSTVTGEGVVLAQRLEQLAEPGGICIQDAAYQTIPKRLPFEYRNLGQCELKGFEEPVRVYTVELKSGADIPQFEAHANRAGAAPNLPDKPSIAVLPFNNMSGEPEQEYFSDGITEDIITALSRISKLLVVARNSTMVYKGQAVDVKQVGQEQGVRYVLEGSVRKGGNRVRVTAQLIDATTGHHQWAEHYDRELDDIFAVQDEITQNVALEMQVQLTRGEQARLRAGGTDSVDARERALRADVLVDRHIREDSLEGRRLAEEALRIDPDYAHAWVALGWPHWQDAYWGWGESAHASLEQALEAGQNALGIDETYPDAFALLAMVYLLRGEHDKSIEMAEKAASFSPSHADAYGLWAYALNGSNKPKEAIQRMKRAMRLCPIYPAWYLLVLGDSYRLMGENDLALSALREAIKLEPDSALTSVFLAGFLAEVGLINEAKATVDKVLSIDPTFTSTRGMAGICFYKDPALNEKALVNLRKAGLPD